MIYEKAKPTDPLRQGDLLRPLPLISVKLDSVQYLDTDGNTEQVPWTSETSREGDLVVHVNPTFGIVATQDCDAEHAPLITFFEIREFLSVENQQPPASPSAERLLRWWVDRIITKSKENLNRFYLPADSSFGIDERMAIDFNTIFQTSRDGLVGQLGKLRIGRLIPEAYQHYRESVAQYFRRYPVDEWYPLTRAEFEWYSKDRKRYPPSARKWQQ